MPRRPVPKGVERKRRPDPGAVWLHGLLDLPIRPHRLSRSPRRTRSTRPRRSPRRRAPHSRPRRPRWSVRCDRPRRRGSRWVRRLEPSCAGRRSGYRNPGIRIRRSASLIPVASGFAGFYPAACSRSMAPRSQGLPRPSVVCFDALGDQVSVGCSDGANPHSLAHLGPALDLGLPGDDHRLAVDHP